MTRKEFLEGLREKLSGSLPAGEVQNHVDYYNDYIKEEVKKGRRESEVLDELGDPWVIARSLIGAANARGDGPGETYYEPERRQSAREGSSTGSKIHMFSVDSRFKAVLFLLGIIGIFALLIAVIGGILSLLAPVLVPVLLILIIIRIWNRRR